MKTKIGKMASVELMLMQLGWTGEWAVVSILIKLRFIPQLELDFDEMNIFNLFIFWFSLPSKSNAGCDAFTLTSPPPEKISEDRRQLKNTWANRQKRICVNLVMSMSIHDKSTRYAFSSIQP